MHEWALAEAVAEAIASLSRESGRKTFKYVKIVIGRLRQLDKEVFTYAIGELLKNLRDELGIEVESVVAEDEEIVALCNRCGYRWGIDIEKLDASSREYVHFIPSVVHSVVACPSCGSHDYDIVSGNRIAVDIG